MYGILELTDYDRLFAEDPDAFPLISDHRSYIMKNQASQYFDKLFLTASKANMTFIASCECGKTTGNHYLNSVCGYCKKTCKMNYDELNFRAWLEIPQDLPPIPHPSLYAVLHTYLKTTPSKARMIDVLLDVSNDSELPEELAGVMGRGMRYFYENFTDIMNYFMTQYTPFQRKSYQHQNNMMKAFLDSYKDVLFVRHLPILNSSLHLITEQGSLKRSDSASPHIFEAIIELSALSHNISHSPKSEIHFDQQYFSVYRKYLDYIDAVTCDKLIAKGGLIRKNVLGARCHYSSRAVIVPIIEEHSCDEIYLPWRIGVISNKLELLNLLMNRFKYTLPAALEKVTKAIMNYDKDIHKILNILIKECPYKGLPKQINIYF